jgi:hypothetical protein
MIVHRLLDAVFRTLDTIDAVRARVDAVLGRGEAQPPSGWPATVEGLIVEEPSVVARDASAIRGTWTEPQDLDAWRADADEAPAAPTKKAPAAKAPAKRAPAAKTAAVKASSPPPSSESAKAPKAAKPKASKAAAKPKKEKPASKVPAPTSRKGSVDRSGKDFDSPRARAVEAWLKETGAGIIAEDSELDGKKTLARVLWAVAMAEAAGSEQGLTAADTSALLSSAAGVEVFATNVARTFRDESELFVETTPDGRSKRYTVTAAGQARLAEIATR